MQNPILRECHVNIKAEIGAIHQYVKDAKKIASKPRKARGEACDSSALKSSPTFNLDM